ncbi:catalase-related domain-containing protein, partial [Novosphingobium sp.]|uniref:catalase-related domain-containing protein n=1 Tax=Novosphingobium sp. TaxID=1874826 RepID=UPI00286DCF04
MIPKGRANYEPNSLDQAGEDPGPRECSETGFTSFRGTGEDNDASQKLRIRPESFADHFSQARMMYASQTKIEQAHMASAFVFELSKVELEHVRLRMLSQLRTVDESLAQRVADGLAMPLPKAAPAAAPTLDLDPSDKLSIVKQGQPPMKGRKVGVLFDEGSDKAALAKLGKEIEGAGGTMFLVAPKVGALALAGGGELKAHGQLAGSPSVLFDAVAAVLAPAAVEKLLSEGAAVQWFMDAFAHCKTIGCDKAVQPLLDKAGVVKDEGVVGLAEFAAIAPARHWDREPKVRMLA